MIVSANGLALIKAYEGCVLKTYMDAVGVPTIGYGHTGTEAYPGNEITKHEAESLLLEDLEIFERGVGNMVKVKLSQNQFDALVAWSFNLGLGSLRASTLLKRLNAGDYASAAQEMLRWDKAGGKTLTGLTKRRQAESNLFQGKPWTGP